MIWQQAVSKEIDDVLSIFLTAAGKKHNYHDLKTFAFENGSCYKHDNNFQDKTSQDI